MKIRLDLRVSSPLASCCCCCCLRFFKDQWKCLITMRSSPGNPCSQAVDQDVLCFSCSKINQSTSQTSLPKPFFFFLLFFLANSSFVCMSLNYFQIILSYFFHGVNSCNFVPSSYVYSLSVCLLFFISKCPFQLWTHGLVLPALSPPPPKGPFLSPLALAFV